MDTGNTFPIILAAIIFLMTSVTPLIFVGGIAIFVFRLVKNSQKPANVNENKCSNVKPYKKLQEDMRENKLQKYLKENYPESSDYFGILVPIPSNIDLRSTQEIYSEYQNPTNLKGEAADWKLWTALPCHEGSRTRSTVEMLFCMLRSKHSYTNLK